MCVGGGTHLAAPRGTHCSPPPPPHALPPPLRTPSVGCRFMMGWGEGGGGDQSSSTAVQPPHRSPPSQSNRRSAHPNRSPPPQPHPPPPHLKTHGTHLCSRRRCRCRRKDAVHPPAPPSTTPLHGSPGPAPALQAPACTGCRSAAPPLCCAVLRRARAAHARPRARAHTRRRAHACAPPTWSGARGVGEAEGDARGSAGIRIPPRVHGRGERGEVPGTCVCMHSPVRARSCTRSRVSAHSSVRPFTWLRAHACASAHFSPRACPHATGRVSVRMLTRVSTHPPACARSPVRPCVAFGCALSPAHLRSPTRAQPPAPPRFLPTHRPTRDISPRVPPSGRRCPRSVGTPRPPQPTSTSPPGPLSPVQPGDIEDIWGRGDKTRRTPWDGRAAAAAPLVCDRHQGTASPLRGDSTLWS